MGCLQHIQRLDLRRAQPLGLLSGRQLVSALRQLRQFHSGDRNRLAVHLCPDELDRQCRRQDRRALSGARPRFLRHLGRQRAGTGAGDRRLLLVRCTDGGGLRRDRRAADAHGRFQVLPRNHACAGPFRSRSNLLRGDLGAAAPDHSAGHGDGAALPGLGGTCRMADDAGPGGLSLHQGGRDLAGRTDPAGRAAGKDQGGRRPRRAGVARRTLRRRRDLGHLFRRAFSISATSRATRRTRLRCARAISGVCPST